MRVFVGIWIAQVLLATSFLITTCRSTLQEMYDDAVANFTESLRIREEKLGPSHPDVARSLKNLADMWFKQVRSLRENQHRIDVLQFRVVVCTRSTFASSNF